MFLFGKRKKVFLKFKYELHNSEATIKEIDEFIYSIFKAGRIMQYATKS